MLHVDRPSGGQSTEHKRSGWSLLEPFERQHYKLLDYLEIVDWASRKRCNNKRGFVDKAAPAMLQRLNIEPNEFMMAATQFEFRFKTLAGVLAILKKNS